MNIQLFVSICLSALVLLQEGSRVGSIYLGTSMKALISGTSAPSQNCYNKADKGSSYKGETATTESGRTCMEWTRQDLHPHNPKYNGTKNYCNNPLAWGKKPWCYTADKEKTWEYCSIRLCGVDSHKNCYDDRDKGEFSYDGTLSRTRSGRTCMEWSRQDLHKHNPKYKGEKNYCRNPTGWGKKPWCYTTDKGKTWEYCSIPICGIRKYKSCYDKRDGGEFSYVGETKRTEGGKYCQHWDSPKPHKHDAKYTGPFNYCRNPTGYGKKPWCYTQDKNKVWDYCKIPECP